MHQITAEFIQLSERAFSQNLLTSIKKQTEGALDDHAGIKSIDNASGIERASKQSSEQIDHFAGLHDDMDKILESEQISETQEVIPLAISEDEGDAKFSIFDVNKELHLSFKHEQAAINEETVQIQQLESAFLQADLINQRKQRRMRRVKASERQSLNQPSSRAKAPSPVPFKIVSIPPRPTNNRKVAGRATPKRSRKITSPSSQGVIQDNNSPKMHRIGKALSI